MEIYDPVNKESVYLDHNQTFGPIILEMGCSNIYRSWEKSMVSELSEFKPDSGKKMYNVLKYDWIKSAPSTLCFQLKRALYDYQRMVPYKDNTPMQFDEEIYIDRFMEKNSLAVKTMRSGIQDIENSINVIEGQMKLLYQSEGDGVSMFEKVNTSLKMLNSIDKLDPNHILKYGGDQEDFKASKRFMNSYNAQLMNSKQNLEVSLSEMKATLTESYEDMDKTKYTLTAIIVHTGSIIGGHYYAYIREENIWWRISDTTVTKTSKEMAFKEGIGHPGSNTNAYCLFYSAESVIKNTLKLHHKLSKEFQLGEMFNLVPKNVLDEVIKINKENIMNLVKNKAKTIADLYESWIRGFAIPTKTTAEEFSIETKKTTPILYPN